jgi:hypothetical protein
MVANTAEPESNRLVGQEREKASTLPAVRGAGSVPTGTGVQSVKACANMVDGTYSSCG